MGTVVCGDRAGRKGGRAQRGKCAFEQSQAEAFCRLGPTAIARRLDWSSRNAHESEFTRTFKQWGGAEKLGLILSQVCYTVINVKLLFQTGGASETSRGRRRVSLKVRRAATTLTESCFSHPPPSSEVIEIPKTDSPSPNPRSLPRLYCRVNWSKMPE